MERNNGQNTTTRYDGGLLAACGSDRSNRHLLAEGSTHGHSSCWFRIGAVNAIFTIGGTIAPTVTIHRTTGTGAGKGSNPTPYEKST
jgi:hypothetical protein